MTEATLEHGECQARSTLLVSVNATETHPDVTLLEYCMGRMVFGLIAIIFFQAPSYGYAQERRVRVGFSNFGASTSWLWTAKESGLFERNGLRVDLVYVGGTPLLFQALLAGDLDFGDGGGPG